jgi:hypothetical protein
MYIRWTNFTCPFCSTTWSSRIVTAPRPDQESRTCSSCSREFKTHDIEWAHMTRRQKFGYLLNEWMVGWLLFYAMVIVCVFTIVTDTTMLTEAATILTVSATMLGPFVLVKWLTIRRSKQRTVATEGTDCAVITCK